MRWRPRVASVRLRISVVATLAVAIGLLIGAFALLAGLRQSLLDAHAGTGPLRAAELAALAAKGPLPPVLTASDSDRLTLLQVVDSNGAVVSASAELRGVAPLMTSNQRHRVILHDIAGLHEGSWLAEPTPATLGGRSSLVIVLTSLGDAERSADLLRDSLLIIIPLLVLGVAAVVWLVVGRALRPVEAMRAEVEHITGERLGRRVPTPDARDEVARLATTLNGMLDRLESASDAQRRFVADASHELRSPIANVRAAVEVALAHPDQADWPTVADDVLAQNARMERLTDDLLVMARNASGPAPMHVTAVDVGDLIRSQTVNAVPADRRLETSGSIPGVKVNGDPDHLGRALANLIDNALRHARRRVTVSAATGFDWVEIRVADDGPGIPPEHREAVFRPFFRRDQHRGRDAGGAGLGLAIVRQIVEAHHGTVTISDAGPGAVFIVRLPLSESSQAPKPMVEP